MGSSLESVVLPDQLRHLGGRVFRGCKSLRSVRLPKYLESIGPGAFADCEILDQMVLPDTLKTIDESAFEGSGLKSLELHGGVEKVGRNAFRNCRSLRIAVGEDCEVGSGAFDGVLSLKKVSGWRDL